MKTKQHQQKQAFIIQSLIDRSRISLSNDGLLFFCNSSVLQQTLLFSGKTSMCHTHNAWTCTQWPHSIAPAFFIANLQLTPPMTSKHTPKTKRTHGKQKSATNKRKKEKKIQHLHLLSTTFNLLISTWSILFQAWSNFQFEQAMQIRNFTDWASSDLNKHLQISGTEPAISEIEQFGFSQVLTLQLQENPHLQMN